MYFLTQKPPKNAYLVGLHENSIYAIGEEKRSGHLVIYRKSVLNAGEWDETIDLKMTVESEYKCKDCKGNKKSFACGIIETKLWIMAAGKKLGEENAASNEINGPHIFCVDIVTKEITRYETSPSDINKFLQQICYECNTLQITYYDDEVLGKPRFMVEPNRLQSMPYYNSSQPTPLLCLPAFKQFYFTIDETKKTCEFGYFENQFRDTKEIFQAGIVGGTFRFAFQLLMYANDRMEQRQFRGDYHAHELTNYIEIEDLVYARFFRNENNEFFCLIKEIYGGVNSFKLNIYKVNINLQNQTAK